MKPWTAYGVTTLNELTEALQTSYGVQAVELHRIHAGTNTVNYQVVDDTGRSWFAKLYNGNLDSERDAIELTAYAGRAVPVPAVRRTLDGELIAAPLPMSLWEFVDGETAEGGITGARWPAVGTMLGRLHRLLSEHPGARPTLRPAAGLRDVACAERNFDELIARLQARHELTSFEAWACEAARERRALLGRAGAILAGLPALTTHVLHGDLASPNLMLRGDHVAAVIDFQPPRPGFVAWEIARIGCDPRTVILGDQWIDGLAVLLDAYRSEHPAARPDDLRSVVAAGCAHTLGSTYPLSEPAPVPASLELYARARHQAALTMLDRLPEVQDHLKLGSTR
ncbi:phosphotransferase enzyme family protein [Kribbella sp. NPDC059898]|uniref:phosphotransferase enzyme family protein n=1 Tax=Kribbella sp. NPDC059898 TaxID=3346995 RepID=UPI003665CBFA